MISYKNFACGLGLFFVLILGMQLATQNVYARDPIPQTDFSCFQKNAIEFNSLRPYEAAPCNPNLADETLMCGHDLVAKKKLTFPRNAPPAGVTQKECRQATGSPTIECDYDIIGQFRVQVDLSQSKLPIMGNTNTKYDGQESVWVGSSVYREPDLLTPAQKMNNYVSWYMNGVTGRAEDNLLSTPDIYPQDATKITDPYEQIEYIAGYADTRKVIDYSGPLKKLLPFRIQQKARLDQAEKAMESDNNEGQAGIRHNQTAGCYYEFTNSLGFSGYIQAIIRKVVNALWDQYGLGWLGIDMPIVPDQGFVVDTLAKIPGPCYPKIGSVDLGLLGSLTLHEDIQNDLNVQLKAGVPIFGDPTIMNMRRIRLSQYVNGVDHRKMPEMENYKVFAEYWMDYMRWRGGACLSTKQGGMLLYICFDTDNWVFADQFDIPDLDGNPNVYGMLYQYIPLTSTEDRKGFGKIDPPLAIQPPGDITLISVKAESGEFPPQNDLFYPHMQEGAETASLLQTTFVPKLEDPVGPIDAPTSIYGDTPYCEKIESRTNPGDELFPQDHVAGADTKIDSLVEYEGYFTCTYSPTTDPSCVTNCIANPPASIPPELTLEQYCQTSCTTEAECEKTVIVSSAVYTATPMVDESWMRYVNGPMAIFKMIYPDITENYTESLGIDPKTPVEKILDIPARTNAIYTSDGEQTYAGNYAYERPGTNAQLFFPHIGSIYDYILVGLQYALLPKSLIKPPANQNAPNIDTGYGGIPGGPQTPQDDTLYESAACPTSVPANLTEPENGILCQAPAACAGVSDGAIPASYLALKPNAIDWATNGIFASGGENNLVAQCFNYVVKQSLDAGVNPLYALTIWIQESGGSNYNSNATTCDPSCPTCTVQDMGVNNPDIAGNLEAQLRQFLRLTYIYPVDYPQCFETGCNLASFARVFKYGASSTNCDPTQGEAYAAKTKRNMQDKLGAPCVPKYPTDLTCP